MDDKKVLGILGKSGLTKEGPSLSKTGRFLVLKAKNKKDYILKYQQWQDKITSHLFLKEIFALNNLAPQEELSPFFGNGRLLTFQIAKKPYWYIFDFLKGVKGGETLIDFGFKEKFLTESFLEGLLKFLPALQKEKYAQVFEIFLKKKQRLLEDRRAGEWFQKEIERRKPLLRFCFSPSQTSLIGSFILEKRQLLDRYCCFLSHGDFVPRNIMFFKKNFFLVDWEDLNLTNPAFDLALVYLHSWKKPAWREKLVSLVRKTQKDKRLFDELFAASLVLKSIHLITYLKAKKRLTSEVLLGHKASIVKILGC